MGRDTGGWPLAQPLGALFQNVSHGDTSVNVAMLYKMELEYLGKEYALIKYRIRSNNQTSYNTIAMEVLKDEFNYIEITSDLKMLFDVFKRLKPGMLSDIKSSSINPDNYEEYYPIKEKALDEGKELNLTLLNKALNELERTNGDLYRKVAQ